MSRFSPRKLAAICYDHVGGILGEQLFRVSVRNRWLGLVEGETVLTARGRTALRRLGVPVEELGAGRRKSANICIERHAGRFYPHIGSELGSLLARFLVERGWLERFGREFHVTPAGKRALARLGLVLRRSGGE